MIIMKICNDLIIYFINNKNHMASESKAEELKKIHDPNFFYEYG